MRRMHQLALLAPLLLEVSAFGQLDSRDTDAMSSSGWAQRWVSALLRPRLESIESEIASISQQLENLPLPGVGNTAGSLGLHSRGFAKPDEPFQVTLDLEKIYRINAIVLVPAVAMIGNTATHGYGFPPGFRIQVATDSDFRDAIIVAERTQERPGPRHYPYFLSFPERQARFVRLTVTRHWKRGNALWSSALAEILVMSGPENVALRKPVSVTGGRPSSTRWAPAFLVDGITPLGLPEGRRKSESNGYHSLIVPTQNTVKWVQVDLGQSRPIDRIRLIPAFPVDWIDTPGFGFPVRFRVQASNESTFRRAVTLFETGTESYPPPGNNPVTIECAGHRARFVRVTAVELFASAPARYLFALAELEVISGNEVLSRGGEVQALDSFSFAPRPYWKPEFLTDGFSSERELLPVDVWLRLLSRRQELEVRLESLVVQRRAEIERTGFRLYWLAATCVAVAIGLAAWFWYAAWRDRRLQLRTIREQIARDLHDEVGSNLAAIMHWSGALGRNAETESMRADLGQIERIAKQTSDALRELVWMLHKNDGSAADLAAQMEQVAREMLRGRNIDVAVTGATSVRLGLQLRRNTLLAFREVLSNVLRHSGSENVRVRLSYDARSIRFRVEDDGKGFDPASAGGGWGIRNMRKRAEALKGNVCVESAPGAGAAVEFEAPIRK